MDVQHHERNRTFNAVSPAVASEYLPQIPHRKHLSISALPVSPTEQPTLENFIKVWQTNPFARYLFNSTLIARFTQLASTSSFCALAAYPLARLKFHGREAILITIISTIMIPFQIVMIPLYILTVQLGLKNSYLGVIFPGLASAFGIFLLRQAFLAVPKELRAQARIDGCTELGIWWHVMIPAIKPALVTLGIFVFIKVIGATFCGHC